MPCSIYSDSSLWRTCTLKGNVHQGWFAVCSGVVLQVLFQPKQLTLVTSGDDSDVRVWDLVSKSCVAVLKVGSGSHSSAPASLPPPHPCPLIPGGLGVVNCRAFSFHNIVSMRYSHREPFFFQASLMLLSFTSFC